MEIKKHGYKILIFAINLLVIALAVCGMRDRDKDRFAIESKSEESIEPINADIQDIQNKIAIERENKLRDLNTAPKTIEQKNTVTTKTTTVPAATKAPDKKTKTS